MKDSQQVRYRQRLPVIGTGAPVSGLQLEHQLRSRSPFSVNMSNYGSLPPLPEEEIYIDFAGTNSVSTDFLSSDNDNIDSDEWLSEGDVCKAKGESPNQEDTDIDPSNDCLESSPEYAHELYGRKSPMSDHDSWDETSDREANDAPIRRPAFIHRGNFGFRRLRCRDNQCSALCEPSEPSDTDESLLQDRMEEKRCPAPTAPHGRPTAQFPGRRFQWHIRVVAQDRCSQESAAGEVPSLPSSAVKRLHALRRPSTA
eukprot:gnl/TRDRNA2_/TRDRNA2_175106_c0_seq10.p1 gnl/TRDRNA2_/TRDRNA2_175106_c0~~gnl/TRDRNA2_/TRDRNA2_175106_c0_seq10.p1  ORF type:complete len:256 (-),score=30.24 gnl/TRDRNA2_/TRDRNA2_175106_c0_seq10:679-1446(-)